MSRLIFCRLLGSFLRICLRFFLFLRVCRLKFLGGGRIRVGLCVGFGRFLFLRSGLFLFFVCSMLRFLGGLLAFRF